MSKKPFVDSQGTVFDPAIHQKRNGKPLTRKADGVLVLKRGKVIVAKTAAKPPAIAVKPLETAPQPPAQSLETAPATAPELHGLPPIIATDSTVIADNVDGSTFPEPTTKPLPADSVDDTAAQAPPPPSPEPTPASTVAEGGLPQPEPTPAQGAAPGVEQIVGLLASDAASDLLEYINVTTLGEGMRMTQIEKDKINAALKRWFGDRNFAVPPWLEAAICLGGYYFVRIAYIKQVAKERAEAKKLEEAKAAQLEAEKKAAAADAANPGLNFASVEGVERRMAA